MIHPWGVPGSDGGLRLKVDWGAPVRAHAPRARLHPPLLPASPPSLAVPPRSSSMMSSQCSVWGNMSTGTAPVRRNGAPWNRRDSMRVKLNATTAIKSFHQKLIDEK